MLLLKIAIAAVAIYFVLQQIDIDAYKQSFLNLKIGWLILALLAFNASKILSAFRLNFFFKVLGLQLPSIYNLRLYYLGMLYNQVLPGGIGGDGYKVYFLNKHYKTPVKGLITATLLDRVSGVVALGFLAFGLGLLGSAKEALGEYGFLIWIGLLIAYPTYYLLVHFVFSSYKKINNITNLQAIGVQGLQLVCAYLILRALGVEDGYVDYLTLFLVTSVAASLPISLPGGIGIREAIFVFGYTYFSIDQTSAVALASLFFLVSFASALGGLAFLNLKKNESASYLPVE